jgi:hypothetical protein
VKARGSAPLESIFAVLFLLLLSLGVIQVTLALYGRNVVISSAHEGARAAIEFNGDPGQAALAATQTVRRATGRLVDHLTVAVSMERRGEDTVVRVELHGVLRTMGPVSVPLPVTARATSTRPGAVP